MKRSRVSFALFVIVLLLGIAGSALASFDAASPDEILRQGDSAAKEGITLDAADTPENNELTKLTGCRQIVGNPQLDVIEFAPGLGTAEPWLYLKEIIYFREEGDGSNQAYDGYSLVLPDGDDGDPSPNSDILSQIVTFDNKLNSVTVAYQRAMIDSNPGDKAFGELWRLTAEGGVDLGNPGKYRVTRWQVSDSEGEWAKEAVEIEKALLDELSGQEIALLLRTETDGGGASEAEMEWVLFDDVTITTCIDDAKVYLPVVLS